MARHLHAVTEREPRQERSDETIIAEAMVATRRAASCRLLSDEAREAVSSCADMLDWTLKCSRWS